MTNSTSSARGKQLFNSLLTMTGLVTIVVAGVAFYANTKDSRDAYASSHATWRLSQQTGIPDSGLTSSIPETAINQPISGALPMEQSIASSNPDHRWKGSYRAYRISDYCNGSPSSGANFRQYPAMDSNAILGAVDAGQTIWLTGRRIKSDGVVWYEAVNPILLVPTTESTVQNKLDAYQVGWIADCFLE